MKSWKTTLGGVATILAGVSAAIKFALANDYGAAITTLTTTLPAGIALIFARDNNVSSEQAGVSK